MALPQVSTSGQSNSSAADGFTFRSWLWLFAGALLAELGVLLPALVPGRELDLSHLGVMSLFAQWINILALAALFLLEPWLVRLPRWLTWFSAWALLVVTAALVASLVQWVDQALLWGLTDEAWPEGHFVSRTILMAALLAGVLLRYQALHRQWQEGLVAQEQARFQALQARIHPHFLFNSLNSIAALTAVEPAQAERAIENLADLLRGSLRDPNQPIALSEELHLCRSYLEIEALRLGPRLQVEWQLDALPETMMVPPLLLQPLVENAVLHGIQPLARGGVVTIKAHTRDNELILEVHNPVASPQEPNPTSNVPVSRHRQSGIALNNLRARLDLRYAGAARLSRYYDAEGYHATLRLPLSPGVTLASGADREMGQRAPGGPIGRQSGPGIAD